jgi:hypothetical protein
VLLHLLLLLDLLTELSILEVDRQLVESLVGIIGWSWSV